MSAVVPDRARIATDRATPSLDATADGGAPRSVAAPKTTSEESAPSAGDRPLSDATTLIVHVLSKVDRVPLTRVRVGVELATSDDDASIDVDATHGDLAHDPISDAAGRVELEVPSGAALHVTARSEAEGCGRCSLEVQALSAHEKREIDLLVPCGEDLHFFGRLLDSESREPVAGASVRLMRLHGGTTDDKGN
jgi:hypothetical protein